jgi:hypothetical protein
VHRGTSVKADRFMCVDAFSVCSCAVHLRKVMQFSSSRASHMEAFVSRPGAVTWVRRGMCFDTTKEGDDNLLVSG